jgi:hypothetical protein
MKKSRDLPSDEQRAFVLAATAVGLPREMICQQMPRRRGRAPLDPDKLDETFAEERQGGPMLALRFIVARVLHRALTGSGEDAVAAQMAVFKTVADWRQWGDVAAESDRYDMDRLTRAQRSTLRWLLTKAEKPEAEGEAKA